jgi:hypothetical protein
VLALRLTHQPGRWFNRSYPWDRPKRTLAPGRSEDCECPIDVIAIKQLYASHYFQTALDLYFCVPGNSEGFYLVTVKGSEQAGLTGVKGSTVRKVATDKTRSSLEKSLEAIKAQLEK